MRGRAIEAIKAVISDCKMTDPSYCGEIESINGGVIVTDGFVVLKLPHGVTGIKCRYRDKAVFSCNMERYFSDAMALGPSQIYTIQSPFKLIKVASTLPKLIKENKITDSSGKEYVSFSAKNDHEEMITATFKTRHITNAFLSAGRKAMGDIRICDNIDNGRPFLFVYQNGESDEPVSAIILQSNMNIGGDYYVGV